MRSCQTSNSYDRWRYDALSFNTQNTIQNIKAVYDDMIVTVFSTENDFLKFLKICWGVAMKWSLSAFAE